MNEELSVKHLQSGIIAGERVGRIIQHEELCKAAGVDPEEYVTTKVNTWSTSFKQDDEIVQVLNTQRRIAPKPGLRVSDLEAVKDELVRNVADIQTATGRHGTKRSGHLLYEVDVFDTHLAKLAWARETGTDYDLTIARQIMSNALTELVRAVRYRENEVSRILLPIGQDLFHVDTVDNLTTAGTLQDVDSRWQKAFLVARDLLVGAIKDMRRVAPVDVIVVPGNHDTQKSWYLGEVIDAYFRGDQGVRVDNTPTPRKYYRFGKTLLGFAHGQKEKVEKLGLLMAQERPQDWAETTWREWHLGHLHRELLREELGVVVRHLPSIAGTDAWHNLNLYAHANRGARGFLWSSEGGAEAQFNFHIRRES